MYCSVVFVYKLSVSLRKQRPGSLVEKFLNTSIRVGRFFFLEEIHPDPKIAQRRRQFAPPTSQAGLIPHN